MPNCWFCYKDAEDEQYHKRCCRKFFGTDQVPELKLDKQLLHDLAEENINKRIAVTGVQPKLSLTLQKEKGAARLTIVGLWGEYILKPQHERYPWMPETEDLTMHLASVFKLTTCGHCLIRTSGGELAYIARRFDRRGGQKIHVEDFCQLSEFLTEQKYKGSYEKAGKLVLKYCTNRGLDALTYFELVLFSFLTGNNDMHLKNFSLVHGEGDIRLSPAYDLLNVALVNPADQEELGLILNGKKSRINKDDFIALATSLNIPEKAWTNSFKKFSSKDNAVEELLHASILPEEAQHRYYEIWTGRKNALHL